MDKIIIPTKSIVISFCSSIGRLGNYLYNIALCTRILYDINQSNEFKNYNKYLYFYCTRTVPDGHGNENAYNYYENSIESYHNSIFKYDEIDKSDKIYMITDYYGDIIIDKYNNDKYTNKFTEQLEREERLIFAKDVDKYEIFIDNFPFIIEVLKYKSILLIYINNCNYEGISHINAMYKNLYPINNNIMQTLIPYLLNILLKYKDVTQIFIYLNFVILSNYLTYHTDEFNLYFTKKLYNYKIDNVHAYQYVDNIYKTAINKYLPKSKFISLHFRGGDYGDPLRDADTFAVIGPQYYIDCINDIAGKNRNKNLIYVLFCAPCDLKFINNMMIPYLIKKTNKTIICYSDFLGEDNKRINTQLNLYLMGLFDYTCISNSTYSWWSSYFSHNFNNKKQLYSPLLYKYPLSNYQNYDHSYSFNNKTIILNNHVCNVMVFYGYNSTLYMFILLKRFIRQIAVYILQINIDIFIFIKFITAIKKYLIKEKLIETDKINSIIEEMKLLLRDKNMDKLKLQRLIEEIYLQVFLKSQQHSLKFTDNYMRYAMIKIDEIFCSKDRSSIEYKDMQSIEKGIIKVCTIRDEIYHEIIG